MKSLILIDLVYLITHGLFYCVNKRVNLFVPYNVLNGFIVLLLRFEMLIKIIKLRRTELIKSGIFYIYS